MSTEITRKLEDALRKRYPPAEYALFFEVANKTGSGRDRSADAIAMSLWPSRGLAITGFEIKASRGDWLREKRKPAKAESIARFCDFWYVVAPEDVVKPDELPEAWGLLELRGSKLVTARGNSALEGQAEPVTRAFFASLCRSLQREDGTNNAIETARREGLSEGFGNGVEWQKKKLEGEIERANKDRERYKVMINEFTERTGLHFDSYVIEKYAEAIRMLRDHKGLEYEIRGIENILAQYRIGASALQNKVERLKGLLAQAPEAAADIDAERERCKR